MGWSVTDPPQLDVHSAAHATPVASGQVHRIVIQRYSPWQRLRSLRHRFWYGVSRRLAWSRGMVRETPAGELPARPVAQTLRIAELRRRFEVRFEGRLSVATSLNNYEYLDLLDRAFGLCGLPRPTGGVVVDVGCASFWYAAAWQAFFRPSTLIGVEVEGHRLFKDGHTRIDYAAGYLADLPRARFLVANYADCDLPADVITACFPFVTAPAILAWRLPLTLLEPERLLAAVRRNLRTGGVFLMANHGLDEATRAKELCDAANLTLMGTLTDPGVFGAHRSNPAILSVWRCLTTQNSY